MICDICEIRVNSDKQHGLPRYSCAAPAPGEEKGYHASAQVEIVDPWVKSRLFKWLASRSFVKAFTKGDDELLKEIEEAEAEAALLRKNLQEFYDEAGAGRLSAAGLAAVEADMLPKIKEAEGKARALGVPAVVRDLVGLGEEEIAKAWENLDLAQRRLIAETLIEVRLKPQGPGKRDVPPAQFVAVIPKQLVQKKPRQAELAKAA
jgi:hypothetical protein